MAAGVGKICSHLGEGDFHEVQKTCARTMPWACDNQHALVESTCKTILTVSFVLAVSETDQAAPVPKNGASWAAANAWDIPDIAIPPLRLQQRKVQCVWVEISMKDDR